MVDNDHTKSADDQDRPDPERESDDSPADSPEIYDVLSAEEPRIGDVEIPADESAEVADRWFFAPGGRARQGPVSFSALKQKAAGHELAREDLVWREDMPKWKRAGDVAGLFDDQPPGLGPQPPRLPTTTAPDLSRLLQTLPAWPCSSDSLRLCGYVAAGLAGLTLMISLILRYWGHTWFTGAVLFMLVFVVCQGMAAILDAVNRLEVKAPESREPKGDSPAGE